MSERPWKATREWMQHAVADNLDSVRVQKIQIVSPIVHPGMRPPSYVHSSQSPPAAALSTPSIFLPGQSLLEESLVDHCLRRNDGSAVGAPQEAEAEVK
jgi:hypothetical protein